MHSFTIIIKKKKLKNTPKYLPVNTHLLQFSLPGLNGPKNLKYRLKSAKFCQALNSQVQAKHATTHQGNYWW